MTAVFADAKLSVLLQYKHFGSPLQSIIRYEDISCKIMTNHRKRTIDLLLLMGVYATRHVTHSIIYQFNAQRNDSNNKKIYLERKKCITSITSFNA